MPGRPRKTTLKQRQSIRCRVEKWAGPKKEIYAQLAQELKVSFSTIERIVLG